MKAKTKAQMIVEKTKKYCLETTFAYPLVIKSGKGCWIEDVDGKKYLDFNANVCTNPLGYSHPAIIKVLEKYSTIGAYKIAGQDFYTEEQAQLAEKLIKISPPNLEKVFLVNSGAEAVENAIKLCYRKRGPKFGVSCYGAFHGRTLGALTFTFSKEVHKRNFPELPVRRIKFCTSDDDPAIDDIEKIVSENPDNIAHVIVEVVQGEGGYNIASKRFIQTLRRITELYEIPLIIDEVQSGLGRTGKWWAFEHYGIRPNIITAGKALQVGATIFEPELDPKEKGALSSTWGGGHRIDMAVGLKIIETIEKERLMDNVKKVGKYFLKRLRELEEKYPNTITYTDGLGLMLVAEIDTVEKRDKIVQAAFKNGLLLLGCGEKRIRFSPPLIITEKEIDYGLEILEKVVKEV
jgi:4-aminobutyrate aminotransferase